MQLPRSGYADSAAVTSHWEEVHQELTSLSIVISFVIKQPGARHTITCTFSDILSRSKSIHPALKSLVCQEQEDNSIKDQFLNEFMYIHS